MDPHGERNPRRPYSRDTSYKSSSNRPDTSEDVFWDVDGWTAVGTDGQTAVGTDGQTAGHGTEIYEVTSAIT